MPPAVPDISSAAAMEQMYEEDLANATFNPAVGLTSETYTTNGTQLDNIIGAGRHIACDPSSHSFLREIPQCWLSGQAAGVAAALSAGTNRRPRDVAAGAIQRELLRQGAYLSPATQNAVAAPT